MTTTSIIDTVEPLKGRATVTVKRLGKDDHNANNPKGFARAELTVVVGGVAFTIDITQGHGGCCTIDVPRKTASYTSENGGYGEDVDTWWTRRARVFAWYERGGGAQTIAAKMTAIVKAVAAMERAGIRLPDFKVTSDGLVLE